MASISLYQGEAYMWTMRALSDGQPVDLSQAPARLAIATGSACLTVPGVLRADGAVEFDVGAALQAAKPWSYRGVVWIDWPTGPQVATELKITVKGACK